MRVYLASPNTQQQAEHAQAMPVLMSFGVYSPWMDQYVPGYGKLLIDSGAYSEINSGKSIDLSAYCDWSERWADRADAVAGLDDISGDWRKSLANYERVGFPTFHDTDPEELLPDLIDIARERRNWLGIGLLPPRAGREDFLRRTLDRIPDDIHIHGWALRAYWPHRFGGLNQLVERRNAVSQEHSLAQLRRMPGIGDQAVSAIGQDYRKAHATGAVGFLKTKGCHP
jgi:hypothetical protein